VRVQAQRIEHLWQAHLCLIASMRGRRKILSQSAQRAQRVESVRALRPLR